VTTTDRGTILTPAEMDRLNALLALTNDLNVTQLDTEEAAELRDLLERLAS
jgi:hypothetical protein